MVATGATIPHTPTSILAPFYFKITTVPGIYPSISIGRNALTQRGNPTTTEEQSELGRLKSSDEDVLEAREACGNAADAARKYTASWLLQNRKNKAHIYILFRVPYTARWAWPVVHGRIHAQAAPPGSSAKLY